MARHKGDNQTDRQENYAPTSFHMNKTLKKAVARHVFEEGQGGRKTSQEKFINDAVKEKCERDGIEIES